MDYRETTLESAFILDGHVFGGVGIQAERLNAVAQVGLGKNRCVGSAFRNVSPGNPNTGLC